MSNTYTYPLCGQCCREEVGEVETLSCLLLSLSDTILILSRNNGASLKAVFPRYPLERCDHLAIFWLECYRLSLLDSTSKKTPEKNEWTYLGDLVFLCPFSFLLPGI